MKKIITLFAAAAVAISSFTSCEQILDALLGNYIVGDELVIVGSSSISSISSVASDEPIAYGIMLKAKDESTPNNVFNVLLGVEQYNDLMEKGMLDINGESGAYSISGTVQNGDSSLTILSPAFVGGTGDFEGYDNTPVSCEAVINASLSSSRNLTFKCKAKVVLSKKEDVKQTKEFNMTATYTGPCEVEL